VPSNVIELDEKLISPLGALDLTEPEVNVKPSEPTPISKLPVVVVTVGARKQHRRQQSRVVG